VYWESLMVSAFLTGLVLYEAHKFEQTFLAVKVYDWKTGEVIKCGSR
jgi:hypothetical protein